MSLRIAAALALAASLLAGTAHAQGTLRIGMQDDPDLLDPAQAGTYAGRIVFASLCDKLVDINDKLDFVPQLATAWSWSPDNLALTLTLRDGVTFHDGTPFDAEAVRVNLERFRSAPESVRKAELKSVSAVEVVDPHTVRIVLSQPFAPLLAVLADRAGMMLSPKAIAAAGKNIFANPVCAGPFHFTERVAQDHITLDRFPGYWNAAAIHLDRVVFRPIPDSTARLLNLQAGSLDLIEEMAPSDIARVRADKALRAATATALGYEDISINVGHGEAAKGPLGSDPRVRAAFDAAIDRRVLNQVALEGLFVPDNQSELPTSRYFDPAFPVPARDLAHARALLKEAGQEHVVVTLRMANTPREIQIGEVLQSMVAEAGFDLKLLPTEVNAQIAAMNSGDYQASIVNWSGRADPDFNLSIFLASDGFQNWGRYNNPAFDAALARGRGATDPDARRAAYHDVVATYIADRPNLFLFHTTWLFGMTNRLDGFTPVPDGLIRPQNLVLRTK